MKHWRCSLILICLLQACTGEYLGLDDISGTLRSNYNVPIGNVSLVLSDAFENAVPVLSSDTTSFFLEQRIDSALTIYADSLLPEMPDFGILDSFSIGNVSLPNFTVSNGMTLSQFGAAAGGTTNTLVQSLNGTTQVFPQLGPITGGQYPLQGSSPICSALLSQGTCELSITNGWPTAVSMVMALVNTTNNSQLASFNFLNISPGQTVSQIKSLVGKQIGASLTIQMISVSTLGSGGQLVYINTSDAITMNLTTQGLAVEEGSVVFPQSQLYSEVIEQTLSLPTGVILSEIDIEYAEIKYSIQSPVNDDILTSILLPNSFDGFGEFGFQINTSPFLPDTGTVLLQNVTVDLAYTGTPNTFVLDALVELADISDCIDFTFDEAIQIEMEFKNVQLKGATGYFGEYSFSGNDSVAIESIDLFPGATMLFFEPELTMSFTNSIGVPIFLDLDLESVNSQGTFHETVSNFAIDYPAPKVYPRERPSTLLISPKPEVPFIEIPSNTFIIGAESTIASTPIQSGGVPNFVQKGEDLSADIAILQRSKFAISGLGITDTISTGELLDTSTTDNIESISLIYSGLSTIPLDVVVQLEFADANFDILFTDTLRLSQGTIDGEFELDATQLPLMPDVRNIVYSVTMNTSSYPNAVYLKPSDYLELAFALQAKLNYGFSL